VVRYKESNLFRFLHNSIRETCGYLGIATDVRISSAIMIDHGLKKQDKVLALCRAVGASTYINSSGGVNLYSRDEFQAQGIDLKFIRAEPLEYAQFQHPFVPLLSIVDVMMFNPIETVRGWIASGYALT
jgi:hypothetical protein